MPFLFSQAGRTRAVSTFHAAAHLDPSSAAPKPKPKSGQGGDSEAKLQRVLRRTVAQQQRQAAEVERRSTQLRVRREHEESAAREALRKVRKQTSRREQEARRLQRELEGVQGKLQQAHEDSEALGLDPRELVEAQQAREQLGR